jgi:hypothetical protein
MSAAFIPLVPGAPASNHTSFITRVKPIPASAPAFFEPVTPAKLKPESMAALAPTPAPHVPHGPPKVTLERQGEVITHIRIECSCGQVTELKCEY